MDVRSALLTAVSTGAFLGVVMASFNLPTPSQAAPVTLTRSSTEVVAPVEWDIPIVRNESVDRFVEMFEKRQSDRMALYLKRSGRYEGMIRSKLRERGMPEDLLYLSMVESGFNPTARSKASAVGLWQFIASTGRLYGLRIDTYVDERRDPERSTDAALHYLSDLHRQLGSWSLAAAAYNSGGNRVARIMREVTGAEKGQESDFWRIRSKLPSETREYVPLIYAAAIIGKEPQRYGLEDVERLMPHRVEKVEVPANTSLATVAQVVGVEAAEIEELNPQLIQGRTPPGKSYPVRVPFGRAAAFVAHAAGAPDTASARSPAAGTHLVSNGESLVMIAGRYGITVAALQRENGMDSRTLIRPGQTLRIPV